MTAEDALQVSPHGNSGRQRVKVFGNEYSTPEILWSRMSSTCT